jgi:hypothetical protein
MASFGSALRREQVKAVSAEMVKNDLFIRTMSNFRRSLKRAHCFVSQKAPFV